MLNRSDEWREAFPPENSLTRDERDSSKTPRKWGHHFGIVREYPGVEIGGVLNWLNGREGQPFLE